MRHQKISQEGLSSVHALADADWTGDRQSRKSVSGGMILHGKHLIKAWTKQQSIVATSTAGADLYAGNRAATVDGSSGVCRRPG